MRAKFVKESIQVPFSNKNRNAPISGSYPLSKIQYEDADKKMGFREDSDPIDDMGIGMKNIIYNWVINMNYKYSDYIALSLSITHKKDKFVQYLIKNILYSQEELDGALGVAASYGRFEMVKYLIKNGAKINSETGLVLSHAAASGNLEIVKYLVKRGADIHKKHESALQMAIYKGHYNIVKYLIQHGADISTQLSSFKWLASNNKKILKYLIYKSKKMGAKFINEKFEEDSDPIKDMGIGNPFRAGNIIKSKPNKFIKASKAPHRNLILGSNNPHVSNHDYYGLIVKDTYKGGKLQLFILFFSNYADMLKDLPYINTLTFPEIDKDYDVIKGEYTIEKWNEYFTVQK